MTGEEKNEETNQKALLAAGVLIGVVGTFGAIIKAAIDQAAKKAEES